MDVSMWRWISQWLASGLFLNGLVMELTSWCRRSLDGCMHAPLLAALPPNCHLFLHSVSLGLGLENRYRFASDVLLTVFCCLFVLHCSVCVIFYIALKYIDSQHGV